MADLARRVDEEPGGVPGDPRPSVRVAASGASAAPTLTLAVHAFVCRKPDENHERVYRWLLERNLRMYAVAFGLDHHGDIYLDARLPLSSVTPDDLDRLLGSVLTYADESFNTILELGFATSIRKEWEWRLERGESTRNLDAFRGWLEAGTTPETQPEHDPSDSAAPE